MCDSTPWSSLPSPIESTGPETKKRRQTATNRLVFAAVSPYSGKGDPKAMAKQPKDYPITVLTAWREQSRRRAVANGSRSGWTWPNRTEEIIRLFLIECGERVTYVVGLFTGGRVPADRSSQTMRRKSSTRQQTS